MRYAVAVEKGNFGIGHVPRKMVTYCLLLLQTVTITATVRDSHHYSNDLCGLEDYLLYFSYMAVLLAEACAVITNSTSMQEHFWYIIFLNTAAVPFNFPIIIWREENDNYAIKEPSRLSKCLAMHNHHNIIMHVLIIWSIDSITLNCCYISITTNLPNWTTKTKS